jgi:hypothetical protein
MSVRNQVLSALSQAFASKLKELDLEPIEKQLIQSGWTRQQATLAINRYKMFLSLVYLHPHTPLVPTQEIDRVWHCHILQTRKYFKDCQMLFGRFIHHEPDSTAGNQADQLSLDTAFAQTTALLVQYFGDAALGDTKLEQSESTFVAKNLPQQQELCEKGYSHLHRSACGRPRSRLLETSNSKVRVQESGVRSQEKKLSSFAVCAADGEPCTIFL